MSSFRAAALLLFPALCGCDGAPAELAPPARTVSYYSQHPDEAQRVAQNCERLSEQNQRSLSAREFQEWQISNAWANCQTALSVVDAASMRAIVLKQSQKPEPHKPVPAPEPVQPPLAAEQPLAP